MLFSIESDLQTPLSGTTERARTQSRALIILLLETADYLTVTATGSSMLASRKNFAASSGGVGLI